MEVTRAGSQWQGHSKESPRLLYCSPATCVCAQSVRVGGAGRGLSVGIPSRPQESVLWSGRQDCAHHYCGAVVMWVCSLGFPQTNLLCAESTLTKQIADDFSGFLATMIPGKRRLGWLRRHTPTLASVQTGPAAH